MLIGGLQKSSLIDYPEKISAIIFTQGCNFRCPYCHNPELIGSEEIDSLFPSPLRTLPSEASSEGFGRGKGEGVRVIKFLQSRVGKLDGIVITGGEPTLHKDLPEFIKQIKSLGFAVKLDTNGTNPDMLQELIDKKLIDYVAMDIKAPLEKYGEVVCTKVDTQKVKESIEILKTSKIDYEFRTTVVKSQLSPDDFKQIGKLIEGCPKYYLQRFVPSKTLNKFYANQTTYSDEEFESIILDLKKYIDNVILR